MNKNTSLGLIALLLLVSCSTINKLEGITDEANQMKVIWSKQLDPEYSTGNLPIALNSPVFHEGLLYVGANGSGMVAYEVESGREIWRTDDKGDFHGGVTVYQDHVYYGTTEGRIYARNYLTGEVKYIVDLGASIESKPVIHKGRLLLHLRNHQIFNLDVETGKILWGYKRSVPFLTTLQRVSTPIVDNGKILVGFADGYLVALSLEEGILLWERRISEGSKFIDIDNTPFIYQGNIIISSMNGKMTIVDRQTGKVLRLIDYPASRPPLVQNNGLLIGTTDGRIVLLDKTYKAVFERKISEGSITSLAKWDDKIVATSVDGTIKLIESEDYKVIESKHLGHPLSSVFGELQVEGNNFALMSSRNRLYVFSNHFVRR